MSEREERRISIRLTAAADCKWCHGSGMRTITRYEGSMIIGGPAQRSWTERMFCSCVRSEVQP